MKISLPYILAIVAGVAWGSLSAVNSSLSNAVSQRVGVFQSALMVNAVSAVLAAGATWLLQPEGFRPVAGQVLARVGIAGGLGFIVICSVIFAIGKLGPSSSLSIAVASQLIVSLLIDQFGWFDQPMHPLTWVRLAGVLFLLIGTYLVVRT